MAEYSPLPQAPAGPSTSYGTDALSPRSSLDAEDVDALIEDKEINYSHDLARQIGNQPRKSPMRFLLLSLLGLVMLAALIGTMAASSYSGTSFHTRGASRISLDHVFNGTFGPYVRQLDWVAEAGDGVFSTIKNGEILLVDLKTNTTTTLVKATDIRDESGQVLPWSSWKLSPDMKYLLLQANRVKQWRHSSHGNYYIHEIASHKTKPLIPPTDPPSIAYATWSPTGESVAFVSHNDLYVIPSPSSLPNNPPIRITTTGNASLFHGVPDWVYEEEVFSNDFALWWSPDSSRLAFLTLDETKVDEFIYPVYNPSGNAHNVYPYTNFVTMKYPKPGYANPLVSVNVFDLKAYDAKSGLAPVPGKDTIHLKWSGMRDPTDSIVQEVKWVGDEHLIIKEVSRAADAGTVVLFDLDKGNPQDGRVVRILGSKGEQGDEGWIDSDQTIHPLPTSFTGHTSYLDILPNKDGYNHIALFSPADSNTPIWLTSGSWEVSSRVLGVDTKKGLVYFTAAAPTSIERNLYAAKIPTSSVVPTLKDPLATNHQWKPEDPKPLTDDTQLSTYSADFSPKSGFFVLSYQGPNVPWQKVVRVDDEKFEYVLTDNKALNVTNRAFQMPIITRSTIANEGYELNTMEIRPPSMDDSGRTKYPVLFRVYGGPGSQMVHSRFVRDWDHYLACTLKFIVVIVDGRGTGSKGRKLRNPVRGNLGEMEVRDQIEAARIWASKRYVDSKRIGIWGWSYGGFMASKVVEANAGIHNLAMAVAPVTSWRLYDSIYTERYMDTPQKNPDGYRNASITNTEGFRHTSFLLAHGSGDDNVHFSNSAHLLDMLTQDQVRGFQFRMFTDSDHSIYTRGANRELYEWMTAFLVEKWGRGGVRKG